MDSLGNFMEGDHMDELERELNLDIPVASTSALEKEPASQEQPEEQQEDEAWPDCDDVVVLSALNEAYSELVGHLIDNTKRQLDANKRKQKEVEAKIRAARESDQSAVKKVPVSMFLPPYFKDESGMCPPQNDEAKRKQENMLYDPLVKEDKKWSPQELKLLRASVKASMLQNKMTQLMSRRELLVEKIRLSGVETSEEEKTTWKEEILKIDRQIKWERQQPEELILKGDPDNVDWHRIANTDMKGARTPEALRLKWVNEQSPRWNKGPWSKEELANLKKYAKDRFVSWPMVAERLGTGRSAWMVFEKYRSELNDEMLRREWTREEDEKLMNLVHVLQLNGNVQWDKVTYYMPGRTRQQVRTRYTRTLDQTVKHGRWTDEEDLLLMCSIGRHGAKDWVQVAKGVPGRSDGQCRERWVNVLDRMNRESDWTVEEDEKLLFGVDVLGKGHWAKVCQLLPGRNAKDCLMRFRSLLSTKMRLCNAQLTKLSEASLSGADKPGGNHRERGIIKVARVFRKFNEVMGGDDVDGSEFRKNVAKLTRETRSKHLARQDVTRLRHHRITDEEKQLLEKGLEEISARSGADKHARLVDLIQKVPLDQEETFRMIRQAHLRMRLYRPKRIFKSYGEKQRRIRKKLVLADSEWIDVEFGEDVDEEERRMRVTEALCQVVRKHDQYELKKQSLVYQEQAQDEVDAVITQAVVVRGAEMAAAYARGERVDCSLAAGNVLPPMTTTMAAMEAIKADRSRLHLSAFGLFNTALTPAKDRDVAVRPVEGIEAQSERMNIQLSADIKQNENYLRLKAEMRTLFSQCMVWEQSIDDENVRRARCQQHVALLQREMEESFPPSEMKRREKGWKRREEEREGEETEETEQTEDSQNGEEEEVEEQPRKTRSRVKAKEQVQKEMDDTINKVVETACKKRSGGRRRAAPPAEEPAKKKAREEREEDEAGPSGIGEQQDEAGPSGVRQDEEMEE